MGSRERNRRFRSLGPQAEVISRDLEDGDQCADRQAKKGERGSGAVQSSEGSVSFMRRKGSIAHSCGCAARV
jgi:hypothetical protein